MENVDYTEKVKDHFFNPRNVGEIKDADGVGTVGNPSCGDIMTIYIKVKDNKIKDIKFKTFGCAAAIASSSIATEMVKGKTLKESVCLGVATGSLKVGHFGAATTLPDLGNILSLAAALTAEEVAW